MALLEGTGGGDGRTAEAQPVVSVIIPSYNHARYVRDAIRSVAGQVRDGFALELIVIDDGSKDGSVELLKTMQQSGEFDFKLVVKDNEGLCRTLNRAVREHSTGQYISVIASDDMWEPGKLAKQLGALRAHPGSELCYSNAQTFGENIEGGKWSKFHFTGNVRRMLTVYNFVPAGTVLFTRRLYDAIGGYDETGLKLEDWDFLLRASAKTEFCYVDEGLLLYRVHGESALAKMRAKGILYYEKMKVLHKNRAITSPFLRFVSMCVHFNLDRVLRPLRAAMRTRQA